MQVASAEVEHKSVINDATLGGAIQQLASQLSVFISFVMLTSAAHKGVQFHRVREAARELTGLDKSVATDAVRLAGLLEVSAGVLLWLPGMNRVGALLGALLLTIYFALVAGAIVSNRRNVDCGCSLGARRPGLGTYEVLRNLFLLASALLIYKVGSAEVHPTLYFDLAPGIMLLSVYYAFDELMGVRSRTEKVFK